MKQLIEFLFAGEAIKNPITLGNELVLSVLLALLVYYIYYRCNSALTYNRKFNVTLVMISIASTFMLLLIQGDLAVSFGVMGTLSIIRFRANVKDNRDIGFILWALVNGLAIGTQNFVIAVVFSLVMTIYMLLTLENKTSPKNYLLIIRGTEYTPDLNEFLSTQVKNIRLKAKNLTPDTFELVYDVKPKDPQEESRLTEVVLSKPNVISVNLLSSNSEVE